jgi:hypothetical protein
LQEKLNALERIQQDSQIKTSHDSQIIQEKTLVFEAVSLENNQLQEKITNLELNLVQKQ